MTKHTQAVLLDTNVLFGERLRSLFMELHELDVIQAFWSTDIQQELHRHLIGKQKKTVEQADAILASITDCNVICVEDYSHLLEGIQIKDLDDRHLIAAALHEGLKVVATDNIRDFKGPGSLSVRTIKVDKYLGELVDSADQMAIADAVLADYARYSRFMRRAGHAPTPETYFEKLANCQVKQFVAWVKSKDIL